MLSVDELKDLLGVRQDQQLAEKFGRKKQAVANWRKNGVPKNIIQSLKNLEMVDITGDHNNVSIHHAHLSHEAEMVCELLEQWDDKKRKKLLRIALEMDEQD